MQTAAAGASAPTSLFNESRSTQSLGGDDFFKLMIAQLSNQDPLEPTSNQELLQQISSIRDIELSSTLVESLKSLTGQQRFGSAASLIGNYVTGRPDPNDPNAIQPQGTVVGVRFDQDGQPFLQLDSGLELSVEDGESVVPTETAARSFIGRLVAGLDVSDPSNPTVVEGVVAGVSTGSDGSVKLELDTGEVIDLTNVVATGNADGTFEDVTLSA